MILSHKCVDFILVGLHVNLKITTATTKSVTYSLHFVNFTHFSYSNKYLILHCSSQSNPKKNVIKPTDSSCKVLIKIITIIIAFCSKKATTTTKSMFKEKQKKNTI